MSLRILFFTIIRLLTIIPTRFYSYTSTQNSQQLSTISNLISTCKSSYSNNYVFSIIIKYIEFTSINKHNIREQFPTQSRSRDSILIFLLILVSLTNFKFLKKIFFPFDYFNSSLIVSMEGSKS